MLLLNLLLAFAWMGLCGSAGVPAFVAGFVLGFAVLAATGRLVGAPGYGRRASRVARLSVSALAGLALANARVLRRVVSPGAALQPAIVAVPIERTSEAEALLLATLLALSPDALALDVAPDGGTIFVHAADAPDPEAFRRDIRDGLLRRVRELSA